MDDKFDLSAAPLRGAAQADSEHASVGGEPVHRSKFAYVGNPNDKSTWKLPIHDADHVRNALARFNQADIPSSEKKAVARRLVAAARRYGIDASGFAAQYLSDHLPRQAVLLNGPGTPLPSDGGEFSREFHEIPIAVTGSWVKGEHKFSITKQDLADIVRNFEKRKNDQVVIDYEHASEMPEIAKGGPIPAAGWIHQLRVGSNGAGADLSLQTTADLKRQVCATTAMLYAQVEWTPDAAAMIQGGKYRFFSPAIDWGYNDKETGQPQGATLTSGALTNHPFLEELPPIMLTDLADNPDRMGSADLISRSAALSVFKLPTADSTTESALHGGNKMAAKKFKAKRGSSKGKMAIMDEDAVLGELDLDDIDMDDELLDDVEALMAKKGRGGLPAGQAGKKAKADDDASLTELLCESGVSSIADFRLKIADWKSSIANRQSAIAQDAARNLLLTEAVKDGALDNAKAALLARESKIQLGDYIAAQEAEKKLDEAVRAGKVLPRDRKFFFRDALERPEEFAEYVKNAVAVVNLSTVGLGTPGPANVDQEVMDRATKLMTDEKLKYPEAFKQVLASDAELKKRYDAAHRREMGGGKFV